MLYAGLNSVQAKPGRTNCKGGNDWADALIRWLQRPPRLPTQHRNSLTPGSVFSAGTGSPGQLGMNVNRTELPGARVNVSRTNSPDFPQIEAVSPGEFHVPFAGEKGVLDSHSLDFIHENGAARED